MGNARFTGRCVCGEWLKPAFHPHLRIVFWNCFRCFPVFPRANKKQSKRLFRPTWREALAATIALLYAVKVYGGVRSSQTPFLNLSPSGVG